MLMDEQITTRARELLAALQTSGQWTARADIARATGKNRLSPHDVELLRRLVNVGLIEMRRRESKTPVGEAYDYRVVGKSA